VNYAKQIFNEGDLSKKIEPKSFDRIFAVFDRDDHATYNAALESAKKYNKRFKNDNKVQIPFEVIVSIPCFEIWLLLHFKNVSHPMNSTDCVRQLLVHYPDYNKAATDIFVKTKDKIKVAQGHSERLAKINNALTAPEPYTDIGKLVSVLMNLKSLTK